MGQTDDNGSKQSESAACHQEGNVTAKDRCPPRSVAGDVPKTSVKIKPSTQSRLSELPPTIGDSGYNDREDREDRDTKGTGAGGATTTPTSTAVAKVEAVARVQPQTQPSEMRSARLNVLTLRIKTIYLDLLKYKYEVKFLTKSYTLKDESTEMLSNELSETRNIKNLLKIKCLKLRNYLTTMRLEYIHTAFPKPIGGSLLDQATASSTAILPSTVAPARNEFEDNDDENSQNFFIIGCALNRFGMHIHFRPRNISVGNGVRAMQKIDRRLAKLALRNNAINVVRMPKHERPKTNITIMHYCNLNFVKQSNSVNEFDKILDTDNNQDNDDDETSTDPETVINCLTREVKRMQNVYEEKHAKVEKLKEIIRRREQLNSDLLQEIKSTRWLIEKFQKDRRALIKEILYANERLNKFKARQSNVALKTKLRAI